MTLGREKLKRAVATNYASQPSFAMKAKGSISIGTYCDQIILIAATLVEI